MARVVQTYRTGCAVSFPVAASLANRALNRRPAKSMNARMRGVRRRSAWIRSHTSESRPSIGSPANEGRIVSPDSPAAAPCRGPKPRPDRLTTCRSRAARSPTRPCAPQANAPPGCWQDCRPERFRAARWRRPLQQISHRRTSRLFGRPTFRAACGVTTTHGRGADPVRLIHKPCGHEFCPRLHCRACDEVLHPGDFIMDEETTTPAAQ